MARKKTEKTERSALNVKMSHFSLVAISNLSHHKICSTWGHIVQGKSVSSKRTFVL